MKRVYEIIIVVILLLIAVGGGVFFYLAQAFNREFGGERQALINMQKEAITLASEYSYAVDNFLCYLETTADFDPLSEERSDLEQMQRAIQKVSPSMQELWDNSFSGFALESCYLLLKENQPQEAADYEQRISNTLYRLQDQLLSYNEAAASYNEKILQHSYAALFGYQPLETIEQTKDSEGSA